MPYKIIRLLFSLIPIALILFFPKKVLAQQWPPININCDSGFQTLFTDITYKNISVQTSQGSADVHIVKADLSNGNLDLMVTPRDDMGTTTSTFMTTHSASIAVNGDYHRAPTAGYLNWDPLGLAISEGDRYSESSPEPSIYISEQNEVTFFNRGGNPLWDAISGGHTLLQNGNRSDSLIECVEPVHCTNRHSRTSIGSNNDELILIVVDGNVNLPELAGFQYQCGSKDAINMDGGGSSTLASQSESDLLLNNPGWERTVANHFGICLGSCPTSGPVAPPIPLPALVEGEPRPRYPSADRYPFPCNKIAPDDAFQGDDEFHSLRPYQASPCNPYKEDLALFCGNSLILVNPITVTKTFSPDYPFDATYSRPPEQPPPSDLYTCRGVYCRTAGACQEFPDKCGACEWCACSASADGETETCSFLIDESRSVAVDVSGAEFPIMGYTEPSVGNEDLPKPRVINSVNQSEDLSLDDRVNEYVSWYLNGVNERAEYSYLDVEKNCIGATTGLQGVCRSTRPFLIPNACSLGLLTWRFDASAICTNFNSACCVSSVFDGEGELLGRDRLINYSGPIKKLLPSRIQNEVRVDEIEDANESRRQNARIRHDQVAGCIYGINFFNLFNIGGIVAPCHYDGWKGMILTAFRQEIHLSDWQQAGELPPTEEGSVDTQDFIDKYRAWRGLGCTTIFTLPENIPIIGGRSFDFCFDDPLEANYWSNMFTYIPFSSTEDRLGEVAIKSFSYQPPLFSNFTIISLTISNIINADLFVPHMEESDDLGEVLQQTYAPLGADLYNITDATYIPPSPYCDYTTVRTNPGDDLFAGELSADVEYRARMTCEFLLAGEGRLCERLLGGTCTDPPPPGTYRCDADYGNLDCEYNTAEDFDLPPGGFCIRNPDGCESQVGSGLPCENEGGVCIRNSWASNCRFQIPLPPYVLTLCGAGYTCVRESSCVRPEDPIPLMVDSCFVEIFVTLNLETRTPLADRVWARFVAGTMSVFRRIFPKIDQGGPIEEILDIPTATGAKYTDVSKPPGIIFVGDPRYRSAGGNASLFFPHIGGIKEYFLTGIQTILRPKGYGKQILSGIPEASTPRSPTTGTCQLGTGYCSPSFLTNFFGGDAENASQICECESGSWEQNINRGCLTGRTYDYSVGLFQINLAPVRYYENGVLVEIRENTRLCPAGTFSTNINTVPPGRCVVLNQSQLDACVNKLWIAENNIVEAVRKLEYQGWCGAWKNCSIKCNICQ
jgi:hypothetical protein